MPGKYEESKVNWEFLGFSKKSRKAARYKDAYDSYGAARGKIKGSSVLSGKMLLERIVENNKIDKII